MAHTNSTPNYNLPQFLGTDKPAWLTDINNAMSDIDAAIAAAKTTADTADAGVTALGVTVGNHTSQLSTLSGTVTSQGNTLNTMTSLIGNGVPTTTDQTIIGAINEINARVSDNDIGTAVDLTSYNTAGNKYTCPSDGYVNVFIIGTGTSIAHLGSNMIACTNDGDVAVPVFVRKGQQVYVTLTGGGKASFYPFE